MGSGAALGPHQDSSAALRTAGPVFPPTGPTGPLWSLAEADHSIVRKARAKSGLCLACSGKKRDMSTQSSNVGGSTRDHGGRAGFDVGFAEVAMEQAQAGGATIVLKQPTSPWAEVFREDDEDLTAVTDYPVTPMAT